MPDFNHLLLFVALISPIVLLARIAREGAHQRGWQLASITVFAVAGLSYFVVPEIAGFVGCFAWLILLFLPLSGVRKAAALAASERYQAARRLFDAVRVLHPTLALQAEHSILRAREFEQAGDASSAFRILQATANDSSAGLTSRVAEAEIFRLRQDWEGLLAWSREAIPRSALSEDPRLFAFTLQALGQLGRADQMIFQFSGRANSLLATPAHEPIFSRCLLLVLAFSGRTTAVGRLLGERFPDMPPEAVARWRQISERSAAQVLLSRASETVLQNLERRREHSPLAHGGISPAVGCIIALNLAAFALEILFGGPTDTLVLYRLGALDPPAVIAGQYSRLVSALFLHYGALHLFVNLYALYVLGRPLEMMLGRWRFAACYLISGIGSSIGVTILWRLGFMQAQLLVGASGAVMGIVGTWAGLLLERRHLPMARRRLLNIALIVIIQTIFDFATPQVSMAAHLCGFVSGLLLGLFVAWRDRPSPA